MGLSDVALRKKCKKLNIPVFQSLNQCIHNPQCSPRENYFTALRSVQETKGDLTGWIEFVANAVVVALEQAWKRIEVIRGENEAGGEALMLPPKQERLLTLLRHSPLNINDIMKELRVTTRAGAHHYPQAVVQHKLVARKGGHKTGRYVIA